MVEFEKVVEALNGKKEVEYAEVEGLAERFNLSSRSIAAKLRHQGITVGKKVKAKSSFTAEDTATIETLASKGKFVEEIADAVGKSVNQIKGKLLSMRIYGVKQRDIKPKTVYKKSYTEAEEGLVASMANQGKFIEEIADRLGRTVPQIRGKLLSMNITGVKQKTKKGKPAPVYTEEVLKRIEELANAKKSEAEIADELSLNPKGLHTRMIQLGFATPKSKARFWTDSKVEKLEAIAEQTTDLNEIASEMNTSTMVVAKKLKELGIEYNVLKKGE